MDRHSGSISRPSVSETNEVSDRTYGEMPIRENLNMSEAREIVENEYRLGDGETAEIPNVSGAALREVNIKPLSSGFLVTVGCQTAAVETFETMLTALAHYYSNPAEFEKQWYAAKGQDKLQFIFG